MTDIHKPNPADYEYAGFHYHLTDGAMVPLPGQHNAASKDKHRRAALECFVADGGMVQEKLVHCACGFEGTETKLKRHFDTADRTDRDGHYRVKY